MKAFCFIGMGKYNTQLTRFNPTASDMSEHLFLNYNRSLIRPNNSKTPCFEALK